MKPRKLTMEYFGPYEKETIDFAEFNEASLFLISGKTGSGKTTIFDAMCYALFGSTTDADTNGRSADRLRADFASDDQRTRITFVFEHQGQQYQIAREPKQPLNKTQKVELTYQQDGQTIAITKVTAANELIRDLLGITADQFRQIVLLPQGKFREFLESDSNSKNDLLEELFGTQLYARWTQNLKDQLSRASKDYAATQQKLNALMENLTEVPKSSVIEKWLSNATEFLNRQRQKVAQQQAEVIRAQQKVTMLNQQFHVEQNLTQNYAELEQIEQTQARLKNEQPRMDHLKQTIAELQWARRQQSAYDNWQRLQTELQAGQGQLKAKQQQLTVLKQQLTANHDVLAKLQQKDHAMQQLRQRQLRLQNQLPLYDEIKTLQQRRQTLANQQSQNQQQLTTLAQQRQINQQGITELQDQIQDYETRVNDQQVLDLTRQASQLQQWQLRLNQLRSQTKAWQETEQTVADFKSKLAKLNERLQQAQAEFQEADSRHAALQIAELATHLKPHQPCPVCGSLEHPRPGDVAEHVTLTEIQAAANRLAMTQEKLERARAEQNRWQAQLEQSQTQMRQQRQELTQSTAEFWQMTELAATDLSTANQQLTTRAQQLTKRLEQAEKLREQLNEWQTKLTRQQSQADQISAKYQTCNLKQQEIQNQLAALNGELTTKQKLLPNELSDLPAAQAQLNRWQAQLAQFDEHFTNVQEQVQADQQTQVALAATIQQLTRQQQQQEEQRKLLTKQLQQALQAHDPQADWQRYADDFQKLDQLDDLQEQLNDYQQQWQVSRDRQQQLIKLIDQRPRPDLVTTQARLTDAENQRDQLRQQLGSMENQLQTQEHTYRQVNDLQVQLADRLSDLNQLSDLVNTMDGKNPWKLNLERYILRQYFNEVLQNANLHLARLSNDRYQFVLDDLGGANAKWSGLEVLVQDYNVGKQRSAHTLSGGETFIASLALALALGETIQQQSGGIKIDALFIDEGFGSLDADALGQALNALQSLEGGSRMVGIISHVTELEERIPDQLRVIAKDGRSHVRYRHEFATD